MAVEALLISDWRLAGVGIFLLACLILPNTE
jgi:hypothetical protein